MKSYKILRWFLLCFVFCVSSLQAFDKVIIWGHKLHTHTHSYIHNAFYRAFKHLGYQTYWFDDRDDVRGFDFSNSLFLTEGSVDKNIPLREDCVYILHNNTSSKYKPFFEKKLCVGLQVYTNDCRKRPTDVEVAPFIFYDVKGKCVYFPWATDLLPHEIEQKKEEIRSIAREKRVYWVGTIGGGYFGNENEINGFKRACQQNRIEFVHKNPWVKGISVKEHIVCMQKSYIAPAIVGNWQAEHGYIPCRIFKNISYGHFGVTNSKAAYDLFEGRIIYHSDTYQLFYDAQNFIQKASFEDLERQMDFVRDHHTYINRINTLLDFLNLTLNQ